MSNETITLSVESEDKLRRETWRFWLYNFRLVLDSYVVEARASRRNVFKVMDGYERIASHHAGGFLKEAEVPLPSEIRERAIREFMAKITVSRWSEVGR
jgi:hypothetical protein